MRNAFTNFLVEKLLLHEALVAGTVTASAGFRGGPKGPGPHQRGPPTRFMCLAICVICACHLVIFSEESLFVDTIGWPAGSISLEYYLIL